MLYIATAYCTCVLILDSTPMAEKFAHFRRREDVVVISVGDLRDVGMERAGNSDPRWIAIQRGSREADSTSYGHLKALKEQRE